jgi:5'-nucleotidase
MLGIQVTRLGKRHPSQSVIPTTTPSGETVYWIGPSGAAQDDSEGTDFYALQRGYVSVTPLRLDLTQQTQVSQVAQWAKLL